MAYALTGKKYYSDGSNFQVAIGYTIGEWKYGSTSTSFTVFPTMSYVPKGVKMGVRGNTNVVVGFSLNGKPFSEGIPFRNSSSNTNYVDVNSNLYYNVNSSYHVTYTFNHAVGQKPDIPSSVTGYCMITGLTGGTISDLTINIPITGYAPAYGTPSGSTSVYNITQTTATRSAIVGAWGDYASAGYWTWYYGAGNYNISSGGSTYKTLTNLTPSTTYNYKFSITNNANKNRTYYGTFRTLDYTPPTSYISYNSVTNNSMTINYSTSGSNISQIRVYLNGNLWGTINTTSANGTITVTGLAPDTGYNVSIQSYTPTGNIWGSQTSNVYGVTYPNPVSVINAVVSDILPFSARVAVTSSAPGNTNLYGYTLLDANKNVVANEVTSGSAAYSYANLIPETTYYARVRVRTRNSNIWSGYYDIQFTTSADQASVFLKLHNVWRRGKVWIKLNDEWIVAKNIYVKQGTSWKKNNNF